MFFAWEKLDLNGFFFHSSWVFFFLTGRVNKPHKSVLNSLQSDGPPSSDFRLNQTLKAIFSKWPAQTNDHRMQSALAVQTERLRPPARGITATLVWSDIGVATRPAEMTHVPSTPPRLVTNRSRLLGSGLYNSFWHKTEKHFGFEMSYVRVDFKYKLPNPEMFCLHVKKYEKS